MVFTSICFISSHPFTTMLSLLSPFYALYKTKHYLYSMHILYIEQLRNCLPVYYYKANEIYKDCTCLHFYFAM